MENLPTWVLQNFTGLFYLSSPGHKNFTTPGYYHRGPTYPARSPLCLRCSGGTDRARGWEGACLETTARCSGYRVSCISRYRLRCDGG